MHLLTQKSDFTFDMVKNICEQSTEKLILRLSAVTGGLFLKGIMEKEQVLPDKTQTNLKVDWKMTVYKNDMEKNALLDTNKTYWYLNN